MTKIETEDQYNWAVQRVEELFPLVSEGAPHTDPLRIELELLGNMVADYEELNYNIGEPTLKIGRKICQRLNIDPAIVLGV